MNTCTVSSAMKLGKDVSDIASIDTIVFLETVLFSDDLKAEQFVRDMEKDTHKSLEQCEELFSIFKDTFLSSS